MGHEPVVTPERIAASRIEQLRTERGWSYEALARRMTDAGVTLDRAAVQKTIKGRPPRRIVTDELVAYGKVFKVDVIELLVPPEVWELEGMRPLLDRYLSALGDLHEAQRAVEASRAELHSFMARVPSRERVLGAVEGWLSLRGKEVSSASALSLAHLVTGDEAFAEEMLAEFRSGEEGHRG